MPNEESIRVPLQVRGPGGRSGAVEDRVASNIDLAPTIAELAGAEAADFVGGRSLVPLLKGKPPETWRQAVPVETFDRHDSVVAVDIGGTPNNPPFKALRLETRVYIEYPRTDERELYDLGADPYQLENLASDPKHAGEIEDLHAWLAELQTCAKDRSRTLENGPPVDVG